MPFKPFKVHPKTIFAYDNSVPSKYFLWAHQIHFGAVKYQIKIIKKKKKSAILLILTLSLPIRFLVAGIMWVIQKRKKK